MIYVKVSDGFVLPAIFLILRRNLITMKRILGLGVWMLMLAACGKDNTVSNDGGGLLPTHYVIITDSSIAPESLTLAAGGSVTFVNHAATTRSVVSSDSALILSGPIPSGSSYYYYKDTVGTIFYHLQENRLLGGSITYTP